MLVDDLTFGLFAGIARRIGLAPWFGAGAVAVVPGALLLLVARRRAWKAVGLALTGLGAAVLWVGLLTVSECRTEERLDDLIRVRYYSYADLTREAAQLGLLALPGLGVAIKLGRDRVERERRRGLLSTYLRIATRAHLSGDFDRAIAEFSIAIKVDPDRTETYVKRGQSWMRKGDYDRAIADFDRALKADPGLAIAFLNRGIAQADRGDHARALLDLDRACGLGPNDAAPLLHRGITLARIGESDRAAADFHRVLKITNHSDFTEPARFHLKLLDPELHFSDLALGS